MLHAADIINKININIANLHVMRNRLVTLFQPQYTVRTVTSVLKVDYVHRICL